MTQEFVTLPREVVEHVLDALFMYKPMVTGVTFQHGLEAMQALRAALEQPQGEQEPVAWIWTEWSNRKLTFDGPPAVPSVRDELTKPVWTPLYTHPQPAQKPLTDDQVLKAVRHLYQSDLPVGMGFSDDLDVARAIEAAHNIK